MMRASQFVGRQDQLEHIRQHLDHIATGMPRVLLVQGIAGVGKTRFLEQIRTMSLQRGLQVFAGHCDEMGIQPYAPFVDLMPRLEVEQALALQQNPSDRGESGKLRLMMAVTRAAVSLALHTPVLVMVDDLHLADSPSLDLFVYLAFFLAEHHNVPLLLLGSYRPVPPASRLGRLLSRVRREAVVREMVLLGIDETATRVLLSDLGVARPTQQLVHVVQEATNGIPLFVEEMVLHLIQSGVLYRRRGFLSTRRGGVDTRQLPPSMADAIAIRIQTLPTTYAPILSLAACLGERFSTEQLQSVGEVDAQIIREAIDAGVSHGVLRREAGRWRFVHTLIQQAFRDRLTPAQRGRYHLRVADAFEHLYAGALEKHILEIAHHLVVAGDLADAETVMIYTRRAGDQAFALYAWHEAARYYEAALAAAHSISYGVSHEVARLYFRAAMSHHRIQDVGLALARFESATKAYRTSGNIYGLASALMWQTRLRLMHASVPLGELSPYVPALDTLLEQLDDRELGLRGELLEVLSQAYRHARQTERANEWARRALELGREANDARLCARASDALGTAYLNGLQVRLAIQILQESIKFGRRTDDLFLQNRALSTLPLAFNLKGDLDAAETAALESAEAMKARQDWVEASKAFSHLASVAVAKGDFRAVDQYVEQAMRMVARSRYAWGGFRALQATAFVSALRGWREEAEQTLNMMIEPGRLFTSPGRFELIVVRVFRQLVFAYQSEPLTEHIASLSDELMEVVAHDTESLAPLCAMIELGELTLNPVVTERPAAMLADAVEQGVMLTSGWCFVIPRVLGVAAMMHGAWEQAAAHFVHAMRVADEAGAWPELARAYLDFACMEVLMGDIKDRALVLELLDQAGSIFNELGMVPHGHLALRTKEALLSPPIFPEASDDERPET